MGALFKGVTQSTEPSKEPALSTWNRLEALPVDSDLGPALQAQIADPLWLLARQWQFAEFQGEDAGSPVAVRLTGQRSRLGRYLAGSIDADAAARAVDYEHDGIPLEVLVEREAPRATNPRLAVEAGLQFRRALAARGGQALMAAFIAAYPLKIEQDDIAVPDRAGSQWAILVRDRGLDGRTLATALRPFESPVAGQPLTGLPANLRFSRRESALVRQAGAAWLRWYEGAVSEDADNRAWNPHRQEYALAVSAKVGADDAVLVAEEYTDGELDWYSFRAAPGASLGGALPDAETVAVRPKLPVRVRYPGMPADRLWEFEDANVSLGSLEAGPTDLARLLLVEFALIYGNDWFVVPVEMPIGSLFSIVDLSVTDTFGETTQVGPTHEADASGWRMFQLSAPGNDPLEDVLFLPPTLPSKLEGDPLEEVAMFRDEMANMVWAVERKVQGAAGEPFDRREEGGVGAVHRQIDTNGVQAEIVYRLATPVAPNWLPFVPVRVPGQPAGTTHLERRVIEHTFVGAGPVVSHPKGQLLRTSPTTPVQIDTLWIAEEEVPRAGIVISRSFQRTRWLGGTSHLWVGRSKRTGKGEGSSGLRYDTLQQRS